MTTYTIPISVKGIVWEDNAVWLRKNERSEWELPGGKLDKGEQPEQTVIREVKEELGLEIEVIRIISAYTQTIKDSLDEANGVLVLIYLCFSLRRIGGVEKMGEGGEAVFQKFTKNEIKNLHMPQFYKAAMLKAVLK